MFINDFKNSNEHKLQQITHTLKSVYGVELKLDETPESDLNTLRQSSEIIKNSIVSESQFNTYNSNPEYTKHTLIMEAIKLYLTEIAPKRRNNKIKENAIPSTPPTPSTGTKPTPVVPGTIKVQKGNDTKTIPAAQLASLQNQGYKVVGDDEVDEDTSINSNPELDALMKKYGIEVDESSEDDMVAQFLAKRGATKVGTGVRAVKNPGVFYKASRDNGEKVVGKTLSKSEQDKLNARDQKRLSSTFKGTHTEGLEGRKLSPELLALMKKYGVEDNPVDEELDNKVDQNGSKFSNDPELLALMKKYGVAEGKLKESLGQKLMRMMVAENQDLAQAQTLLAAKALSDDLQDIAEKLAKMSVEDLMPLVDTMKEQFGLEAASGYNDIMKQSLEGLLSSTSDAKDSSDNAINQLQGGQVPGIQDNMGGEEMPQGKASKEEMPEIPEEPLGRPKKEEPEAVSEAWKNKMKTSEKDKGMWDDWSLAELKAEKAKLMKKNQRSAAEQKKVRQIDFAIRAKQKDKWGKIKENTQLTEKNKANKEKKNAAGLSGPRLRPRCRRRRCGRAPERRGRPDRWLQWRRTR